jgi:hypothetical protein
MLKIQLDKQNEKQGCDFFLFCKTLKRGFDND